MTEREVEDFVVRLAAVWASGNSDDFLTVWHPDGVLHHPMLDRPLSGREIPKLHRAQLAGAPGLIWNVVDWTWRDDVVVVEWVVRWSVQNIEFEWRGVDKIRLLEGKILKEEVYSDTAPLRAVREGKTQKTQLDLVATRPSIPSALTYRAKAHQFSRATSTMPMKMSSLRRPGSLPRLSTINS